MLTSQSVSQSEHTFFMNHYNLYYAYTSEEEPVFIFQPQRGAVVIGVEIYFMTEVPGKDLSHKVTIRQIPGKEEKIA